MFCRKCGKEIPDSSIVCQFCGVAVVKEQDVADEAGNEKQRKKRKVVFACVAGIAALCVVIAAVVFSPQLAQWAGTFTQGKGVYVISKRSYLDYEGKETVVEYDLDEHGNVLRANYKKPEKKTRAYERDDYGIATDCSESETLYTGRVDATDEYGQPIRITQTMPVAGDTIFELEWHGEGHLKRVVNTYKSDYLNYAIVSDYNESGELVRHETDFESDLADYDTETWSEYSYEHDPQGRVLSRTVTNEKGEISKETFEYDDNGNVVRKLKGGKTVGECEYTFIEDPSRAVVMSCNLFQQEIEL